MKIKQPSWQIKNDVCTYCEGAELVFSKCPNCSSLVLICGECTTVYEIKGKKKGREVGDMSGATKCFECAAVPHSEFPCATSVDIQVAGFEPADYT